MKKLDKITLAGVVGIGVVILVGIVAYLYIEVAAVNYRGYIRPVGFGQSAADCEKFITGYLTCAISSEAAPSMPVKETRTYTYNGLTAVLSFVDGKLVQVNEYRVKN